MSFREKHLWISILVTVGVWGFYFWRLVVALAHGGLTSPSFVTGMGGLFVGCLVLVVVVEVALTILATVTTRKSERDARDERETLAALKASHVSLMALIALVVSLAMAAYLAGLFVQAAPEGPRLHTLSANFLVLAGNAMLACIVVSELIRFVFTLGLIRRLR
ncbi:hypothetical protein BH10PSE2_BH10PSE2_30200 [soil metagenome]